MTVTIEEVRKLGEAPYYTVTDGNFIKCFAFTDEAPESSVWNKEKALSSARDFALNLKAGITETRKLIETL